MEKMRVQVQNERAFEFESSANEFFRQMNPTLVEQGDFWSTFSFETVTEEEEDRVNEFQKSFETEN